MLLRYRRISTSYSVVKVLQEKRRLGHSPSHRPGFPAFVSFIKLRAFFTENRSLVEKLLYGRSGLPSRTLTRHWDRMAPLT